MMDAGYATLRAWRIEDATWYVAQLSDLEILRFTTESPDVDVHQFRDALATLAESPGQAGFAIVHVGSGDLAGNMAASLDVADENTAEISYWLAAEARGRGLASRAVRDVCSWICDNWPTVQRVVL